MSDDTNNTQIARYSGGSLADRQRYEPSNLNGLYKYCSQIVNSRLCPSHINKPEDALLIIQQGKEVGLTAMQSLQNMHVIKGNVSMSADMMKGVCEASGEVEQWHYEELSARCCHVTVQRKGRKPTTIEWTIEDANKAGLTKSATWRQYPRAMLRHRADSEAARAVFPDLISGLYTPEEIHNFDAQPVEVEAAPQRHRQDAQQADVVDVQPEADGPNDRNSAEQRQDESDSVADSRKNVDDTDEFGLREWSRRDLSDRELDGGDEWQNKNARIYAVCSEAGCSKEVADRFFETIKQRHNVDTRKRIPAKALNVWGDLLESKSAESADGPPERADWLHAFIEAHEQQEAA